MRNNCDLEIDQNNHDYQFGYNRAHHQITLASRIK